MDGAEGAVLSSLRAWTKLPHHAPLTGEGLREVRARAVQLAAAAAHAARRPASPAPRGARQPQPRSARQAARVLHWGKARPCRPSKRGRAAGRKARRQLIAAGESPKVASRLRSDRVAIAELRALERMDAAWPEGEEHMAKLSVNAMIGLWARSTEVVCSVRISSPAKAEHKDPRAVGGGRGAAEVVQGAGQEYGASAWPAWRTRFF